MSDKDIRYFLKKMPYTVRVGNIPGGMSEFITIQAAITYCVTQTPTAVNRWTVLVWPGTYVENIAMAQYVDVVGMDKEGVIIDTTNGTAVTMADNSRLSNLTVNALATAAGSAYAVEIGDADGSRIEDVNIYIDRDVTGGLECVGICEDTAAAAAAIYVRNVRITCDLVINSNTHGISIRQANKTLYIEESYVQGADYGMSIGVAAGAAVASVIWSKQNFFYATAAASRAVFCNGGEIWLHEDSINRGCRVNRANDGLIVYTDGNETYHVFEGMSIQDTLNNIPAAGCKVRVHDGTYSITDSITLTQNNIILEGDGQNTFIDGDGLATGEHAIVISGVTGCVVRNLRIQTEDGGGKVCHCIFIEDGADQTHIEEVAIDDSDSDGIHIEGTTMYDVAIHDVTINDADGYGIFVDMDGANAFLRGIISHNFIIGTGSSGIFFGNTGNQNYCEINNNLVYGAGGQGIQVLDTTWSDLSNNICLSNTSDGIIIGTSGHCNLEGNICYDSGGDGIELATSVECLVSGNTCSSNAGSGIYDDGASVDNRIIGDHCCSNTLDGIRSGGDRVSITGNTCTKNTQNGITFDGAESQVNNNYCYNNSYLAAGTYHGIVLQSGADRSQVNDNYCLDDGTRQEDGIHLDDGANEIQIVGNRCQRGMGSGIALIANNSNCLIKCNYCDDNDDYGIEIVAASCNGNVVENNLLLADVTGEILDNGTGTIVPVVFVPVPNPSTNIGAHPAEQLTDGLDVVSRLNLYIPSGFQELVTAEAIIVPGGTGNMRRNVVTDWGIVCTDVYNANSDAIAAGEVAVTVNKLECIDISAALTGIISNDLVGVAFTREGSHVNDTVGANCYLLGLRLRYV